MLSFILCGFQFPLVQVTFQVEIARNCRSASVLMWSWQFLAFWDTLMLGQQRLSICQKKEWNVLNWALGYFISTKTELRVLRIGKNDLVSKISHPNCSTFWRRAFMALTIDNLSGYCWRRLRSLNLSKGLLFHCYWVFIIVLALMQRKKEKEKSTTHKVHFNCEIIGQSSRHSVSD